MTKKMVGNLKITSNENVLHLHVPTPSTLLFLFIYLYVDISIHEGGITYHFIDDTHVRTMANTTCLHVAPAHHLSISSGQSVKRKKRVPAESLLVLHIKDQHLDANFSISLYSASLD
jgi:hypothetical protein